MARRRSASYRDSWSMISLGGLALLAGLSSAIKVEELQRAPATGEPELTHRPRSQVAGRRLRNSGQRSLGAWNEHMLHHEPPVYKLDEGTKLIMVDVSNELGFLEAEIERKQKQQSERAREEPSERLAGDRKSEHVVEGATNFSVFLISRLPSHIAIQVDIERIDFEPVINCENQELRISVVSEINKRILDNQQAGTEGASEDQGDQDKDDWRDQDAEQATAVPVSEAMSALLNNPLNETLLREPVHENDFRIIDSTIDFLFEQTCREYSERLRQGARSSSSSAMGDQRVGLGAEPVPLAAPPLREQRTEPWPSSKPSARRAPRISNNIERERDKSEQRSTRNQRKRHRQGSPQTTQHCKQEDAQFRHLFGDILENFLEWDDFKIICGSTRQLLVPMRSLKLTVFSDEFGPRSQGFRIKYRFISNRTELRGADTGQFYCRNRRLIDLALKCDGFDDCGDASDESVKLCGFPGGRPASAAAAGWRSSERRHGRKLSYFGPELGDCCLSSEWQQQQGAGSSAASTPALQALIGDATMHLFSAGPLLAPTSAHAGATPHTKQRVKRIVGGTRAPKGAWPAQASLQYELIETLGHFCAATLIHPQYLLTAGHCITRAGLGHGIRAVFGARDLRRVDDQPQAQVRYVDEAHIYPGVDVKQLHSDWENDMNNDVALLRLNAPVHLSETVAPACLPPFNARLHEAANASSCHSLGWGQTHGSGGSNLLKQLELQVVHSDQCSRQLLERDDQQQVPRRAPQRAGRVAAAASLEATNIETYNNQTMICVSNHQGHGICQGDSGGPLYCQRQLATGESCLEVHGVASFIIQYATVGAMCAVENLPGIFAEVSSKTEWISSSIKMFEQNYKLKYS